MVIPNMKMTMYGISSKKRSIGGILSYSCKICLLGETLPKGFENIKISSLTASANFLCLSKGDERFVTLSKNFSM